MTNSTTSIVQVIAIAKKDNANYLGKYRGVKVKDIETRESWWIQHREMATKPVTFGSYYKIDDNTEVILAKVQRKGK